MDCDIRAASFRKPEKRKRKRRAAHIFTARRLESTEKFSRRGLLRYVGNNVEGLESFKRRFYA
jgi:hypothetical protein